MLKRRGRLFVLLVLLVRWFKVLLVPLVLGAELATCGGQVSGGRFLVACSETRAASNIREPGATSIFDCPLHPLRRIFEFALAKNLASPFLLFVKSFFGR